MPSLGEMLRAEREKKGLTLKDIENATNIRALYLEAIEQGNYSVSPGEVFLKGFIRNYANFLGLNGAEFVELYRQSRQTPPDPELQATGTGSEMVTPVSESSSEDAIKKWLFIAAFIVIVGGGTTWWLMGDSTGGEQLPGQPEPPVPPQVQTAPVAPVQPSQAATPTTPPAAVQPKPAAKPIVVVATFSTRSWTRVTADGKLVFEGTPQRGEILTWEAQKAMELRFGNAAAVELTYNGQFLGVQGRNGQVVVKNFTAR
ncbi:helix-turn-helix domain-containing protein [Acetonema longum]|uniref:Transcriptional regulator, XRE family protein n=1 Tax=Acetonema longum DSM 6540 TaxID=1009370 RepID=F7NPE8_9FIRM|nr:RodZ domain-containing protein [Acetonema longum]EGO62110.1 transcriptional regulator, XRE family protein [Acetonema longum DSM 6540]